MKEIIVIEGKEPKEVIRKLIKASSIKMYEELEKEDRICIYGEELKRIKVPETWEDLEKLVIDNCNNYTISIDKIKQRYSIECKGFIFYNFGLVEFSIATKTIDGDFVKFNRCFATDMQPAQMWNIIKSLIGEDK